MQHVERINIEQAADMLEAATVTETITAGCMTATLLTVDGKKVTLVQGSGDEFLLVR